jgi:hypothetical protein
MADYEQQWEDYRRRRNGLLLGIFGYIPITFALGLLVTKLFQVQWLIPVFAACWMLLFASAGWRLQSFPCPRCGQLFSGYNIISRRCAHCALPKYQLGPD